MLIILMETYSFSLVKCNLLLKLKLPIHMHACIAYGALSAAGR